MPGETSGRSLRILHVVPQLGFGGAENHILDLATSQVERGNQAGVLGFREGGNETAAYRALLHTLGVTTFAPTAAWARPRYSPGHFLWLARRIREFQPDLVHTHLPAADVAVGLLNGRCWRRISLVGTLHGWEPKCDQRFNKRLLYLAYRRFDALLSVSHWVKDNAVSIGVREDAISIVHHGIDDVCPDPEASTSIRSGLLQEFGLATPVLLGAVGRLDTGKGIDVLIRALEFLPDNYCVVVVGADGGRGPELEKLASTLGVEHRCRFVGFQRNRFEWMRAFDLLVLPSRWEGFGLVLLEAGSAGVPIVASDIAPLNEIIRHGVDGLLVPVGDPLSLASAVEHLISDPDLGEQLSESFSERVTSEFSRQAMIAGVNRTYEEVVSSE